MFFSIVIPLYNKEAHIKRAVDSVLSQTVETFELLVIDDGSTDKSADLVKKFSDNRIRLIQQENSGESSARNRGIAQANSEYVAFLDADDSWEPFFLETISRLIQSFPQAGAYAVAYKKTRIDGSIMDIKFSGLPDQPEWEGIIPSYLKSIAFGPTPMTSSSVCIPKKTFQTTGVFKENVIRNPDTDLWLRINIHFKTAFSTKVCATYYRDVENSVCNWYLPEEIPFEKTLYDAIGKGQITGEEKQYALELISKTCSVYAMRYFLANDIAGGRRWLRRIKSRQLKLKIKKLKLFFISYLPYFAIRFIGIHFVHVKPEYKIKS